MHTKTEEKILLASEPFIKKSNARIIASLGFPKFNPIWSRIVEKYESLYGPVPVLGIPTSFYLNEIGISLESLILLAENEKKYNA